MASGISLPSLSVPVPPPPPLPGPFLLTNCPRSTSSAASTLFSSVRLGGLRSPALTRLSSPPTPGNLHRLMALNALSSQIYVSDPGSLLNSRLICRTAYLTFPLGMSHQHLKLNMSKPNTNCPYPYPHATHSPRTTPDLPTSPQSCRLPHLSKWQFHVSTAQDETLPFPFSSTLLNIFINPTWSRFKINLESHYFTSTLPCHHHPSCCHSACIIISNQLTFLLPHLFQYSVYSLQETIIYNIL